MPLLLLIQNSIKLFYLFVLHIHTNNQLHALYIFRTIQYIFYSSSHEQN